MLTITIPKREFYNESTNEFLSTKEQELCLEHSLVSISKWESKWNKAFLGKQKKTREELVDYVRCMTITKNVDPNVYYLLTEENVNEINAYIEAPMTSIKWNADQIKGANSGDTVTNELIYYWMITFGIPVEFQKWHLNRLLALIRVCSIKSNAGNKKQKFTSSDADARRRLNQSRRAKLGSTG